MMVVFGLTRAQASVVKLLIEGLSPAEIAEARGVSVQTVRVQTRDALGRLGLRRTAELVRVLPYLLPLG